MQDGCSEIEFNAHSSPAQIAHLADQVCRFCEIHAAYDRAVLASIRLGVAEALNNIVEHAYTGVPGQPITACVEPSPSRCAIRLVDQGRPMPGGKLPKGQTAAVTPAMIDALPEGGFGWLLIRSEVDEIHYERKDGRNILHLIKIIATATE